MNKKPLKFYADRDGVNSRTAYFARIRADVGELCGSYWFITEEEWKIIFSKMRVSKINEK